MASLLQIANYVTPAGDDTFKLKGNLTFASPPAISPVATGARFERIEGGVQVKRAGTLEWITATKAVVLRQNDLVRTGAGSTAEIKFADGFTFNVRPDSLITIEETSEDPATKRRRVAAHVSSGHVNFQTVRRNVPDSTTEISTQTVRATTGELSEGSIRVAESGDADVRIYRGTTQIETKAGDKLQVGASEAVKVDLPTLSNTTSTPRPSVSSRTRLATSSRL